MIARSVKIPTGKRSKRELPRLITWRNRYESLQASHGESLRLREANFVSAQAITTGADPWARWESHFELRFP